MIKGYVSFNQAKVIKMPPNTNDSANLYPFTPASVYFRQYLTQRRSNYNLAVSSYYATLRSSRQFVGNNLKNCYSEVHTLMLETGLAVLIPQRIYM